MIALVGVGAGIGAVLFWLILQIAPPKDSALVQLGKLDAMHARHASGGPRSAAVRPAARDVHSRVGAFVAERLHRRGVAYTSLRQDLALTGKSFESAMGRKVLAFAAGFLLSLTLVVALTLAGLVSFPPGSPLLLAAAVGVGFFFLPDLDARTAAAKRRQEFEAVLYVYEDLVALEMAGSAAAEEALPSVARVGVGWPLALIRDTLYRASRATSKKDQWDALAELGIRIGVTELRDLGQLIKLVAHDGAKVRETLTARAATGRRRRLAIAQGDAGERDQSMRLAQIVLGFGFILFLGYPTVAAIAGL